MKKLFILAALAAAFTGAAQADSVAYMKNKAGGTIRLTDDRNTCPANTNYAYSTGSDGVVYGGCWKWFDEQIVITYRDGDQRMHSAEDWIITTYGIANGYGANANAADIAEAKRSRDAEAQAQRARRAARGTDL